MKTFLVILLIGTSAFAEKIVCENRETSSTLSILFYQDGEVGSYEDIPLRSIQRFNFENRVLIQMDNWAGFYQLSYQPSVVKLGQKFTAELKVTRHEDSWYWVECTLYP